MGWRTTKYASSTTITAPSEFLYVTGCAGGGGGGGGDPTPGGGGGGGGGGGCGILVPLIVAAGVTLTITIGGGGIGGAPGNNGGNGGATGITVDGETVLYFTSGGGGSKGENPNGGSGGWSAGAAGGSASSGGAGAGPFSYTIYGATSTIFVGSDERYGIVHSSSAGGALGFNGGTTWGRQFAISAGTGGSSGGGGGNGSSNSMAGAGGIGGSDGAAGSDATGYGCGGGGGSGNSAGGDGAPGVLFLTYWDNSEIEGVKTKTDFLPSATAGAAGGVFIAGANAATSIASALTTNITGNLSGSVGSVTTVSDKTGYTLSSAGIQAIWDALTSALTTVGSIGKRIVDYLDAAISSRSTYAGSDTAGTTTLLGRVVGTLASGTHQPQSGDAYARLGAPAGASVSADIATKASQASVNALADRLAEQVPTGPVMVLPAPETGQTVAYVRCLSSAGAAESEVIVHVQMVRTRAGATGYAYSGDALVGESNADGLAAITIPRAPGAIFRAWRGDGGRQVTFAGVDAETVAIPDLLGD